MYSVQSAMANWDIMTGKRTDSGSGSSQSIFGAGFKAMLANQGGIQDVFDRLAERFANADVSQGRPGDGAQGTRDYFGDEEGDKVAVDENLLAAMFGNSGLAQRVEDAIAAFFNSDAGANAAAGSYTQRSVSISITAVRYNVSQFDSESGDLMSAQEMLTSLQEKMNELIGSLFGQSGANATDAAEADESAANAVNAAEAGGNAGGSRGAFNYQAFSFSMEMFFSNRMINGMGDNGQSAQFSMAGLAMGGSFQNFTGSMLPSAIYDALTNSGDFSGPFTSLLDGGLGQFGMKSSGFQYSQSGFSLKANSSGDLLGDLLDQLMRNWKRPEAPAEADAADVTDETEEVPAEVAAE